MQQRAPGSWVGWTLVTGALLTLAPSIPAQEGRQRRVLALYATIPGAAGAAAFEATYQKYFGDALGTRLDFHSEFVDLARFSEPAYESGLVDFLQFKYAGDRRDVRRAGGWAHRRRHRAVFVPRHAGSASQRRQTCPGAPGRPRIVISVPSSEATRAFDAAALPA